MLLCGSYHGGGKASSHAPIGCRIRCSTVQLVASKTVKLSTTGKAREPSWVAYFGYSDRMNLRKYRWPPQRKSVCELTISSTTQYGCLWRTHCRPKIYTRTHIQWIYPILGYRPVISFALVVSPPPPGLNRGKPFAFGSRKSIYIQFIIVWNKIWVAKEMWRKNTTSNGLIYEGRSSTEAKLLDAGMISHIILEPFISVDFSSTSTFQLSSSGPLQEDLSTTQDTVSIIFRGIQGVKSTILCRCRGFLECAVRTRLLDFQASLG